MTASTVVDQVHLGDVSELSFADVGAASALVRAGGAAEIRLVGCRPPLRQLLELLGTSGTTARPHMLGEVESP